MRSAMHLLISLPVLLVPAMIYSTAPATAQVVTVGPSDAVKILAQSQAADKKCRHLTAAEHEELSGYVAKAEVAAASRDNVALATSARRTGYKLGRAMACGNNSEELVRAALNAARIAMAQARRNANRRKVKTASRALVTPVRARRRTAPPAFRASIATLSGYRTQAAAYYIERRCRHLSRAQVISFYRMIVADHNALLASQGAAAVARAKKSAVAIASGHQACGSRTAALVKNGYRAIRR